MTDRVRRNGQLSSCEPCRRSKLKCDHQRPHCARCQRRNLSRQCYYHPAPMARQKGAGSTGEMIMTPASPISNVATPRPSPAVLSPLAEILDRSTGLVTMQNIFADSEDDPGHRVFACLTRTGVSVPTQPFDITPAMLTDGIEVLQFILDLSPEFQDAVREECIENSGGPCGGPIISAAWAATHTSLEALKVDTSQEKLANAVFKIFAQTARPLVLPESAADDALTVALSGQNLRWEAIGLSCMSIGMSRTTLKDNVGRCTTADRWKRLNRAFDLAMVCRNFCSRAGQVNDLTLWLAVSGAVLASWCFGDNSARAWSSIGEVTSAITALRFHNNVQEGVAPFYLTELRKRVLSISYELDKSIATFVGRPPHMNRKYFTLGLPLDLADSVLTSSTEVIEAAKAKLDENGWDRAIRKHPVFRNRAILFLMVNREEILELSLGPAVPDIVEQAQQLLVKLESIWASIPNREYDPSLWDISNMGDMWNSLGPNLEYLYSKFLLHKILISQNEGKRDTMIAISHETLRLALVLLKRMDFFGPHNLDLEWVMATFAMPCASVLVLELFRQARQPQLGQPVTLNRSTIIQDISVLISCCDSIVVSGQSNYQICKQAQSAFTRCLDQILNQPMAPVDNLRRVGDSGLQENLPLEWMDFGLTDLYPQDPEWSTWLESFDLQPMQLT